MVLVINLGLSFAFSGFIFISLLKGKLTDKLMTATLDQSSQASPRRRFAPSCWTYSTSSHKHNAADF